MLQYLISKRVTKKKLHRSLKVVTKGSAFRGSMARISRPEAVCPHNRVDTVDTSCPGSIEDSVRREAAEPCQTQAGLKKWLLARLARGTGECAARPKMLAISACAIRSHSTPSKGPYCVGGLGVKTRDEPVSSTPCAMGLGGLWTLSPLRSRSMWGVALKQGDDVAKVEPHFGCGSTGESEDVVVVLLPNAIMQIVEPGPGYEHLRRAQALFTRSAIPPSCEPAVPRCTCKEREQGCTGCTITLHTIYAGCALVANGTTDYYQGCHQELTLIRPA